MLHFLWHLRGSVTLDGIGSTQTVLDRVEDLLGKQRKPITERGVNHVTFDDPLWRDPFGPSRLALAIYDRGRFWIEEGFGGRRLRYDLRSLHGMVFCSIAAFTVFFFGMADGGLSSGLKFAAGAFSWLYGMNILLALGRVPRVIRNAVRS